MNEERDKDRADIDWLEARDRGDSQLPPIDPERAEAYSKMQLEISSLPLVAAPEDGWQDAIYDELDRREISQSGAEAKRKSQRSIALLNATAKLEEEKAKSAVEIEQDNRVVPVTRISDAKKPRRWMGAVAIVAAVAAVVAGAVWMKRGSAPSTELAGEGEGIKIARLEEPEITLEPREGARRSGQPSALRGLVRDFLVVTYDGVEGELRLYRNSTEFVVSCGAGCATARSDGKWRYEIRWETRNKGTYRPVFFPGRDLPASSNDLNRDRQLAKDSVSGSPATIE